MKNKMYLTISMSLFLFTLPEFVNFANTHAKDPAEIILEAEIEALNRWGNRDVWGYLGLMAKNAVYFDEATQTKLTGYKSIERYIAPWNGQIFVPDYKMDHVDVNVLDSFGLLTYNLYSLDKKGDTTLIWNSTEVYQFKNDEWKIIHSHWSLVNPKQ